MDISDKNTEESNIMDRGSNSLNEVLMMHLFHIDTVPLREHRAASKTLGERHQRCPALNHKCNQSKLTARRQVRVTSRPGCLKARDVQPAPAFCHSAKLSVCVSHCL